MARILVVDDDHLLRELLVTCLSEAGYRVTDASNGRDALKLFRREPADLVITDIVMPEQDGLGMITALRQDFPAVPVIAISGAAGNSSMYLNIAAKLGARRVLAKPFTIAELLRSVTEALAPLPSS